MKTLQDGKLAFGPIRNRPSCSIRFEDWSKTSDATPESRRESFLIIKILKHKALSECEHNRPKKRAGSKSLPSQLSGFYILRQLSTHCGSNGDDGGGNKPGAHRTSSMKVPHNNHHSMDMVESIHTGNCCIRYPDSHNSRPQFRLKSERQNAAWERKPIHLPSMQSREAFSYIFPSSFHYQ